MTALLDRRMTLALVAFVGVAMCSTGVGRVAAAGRWGDPLSIVGYVLGTVALVVIGAGLLGQPLPYVTTRRRALLVVLAIIVVKVALTALHNPV